ncbi:unnamed protein product [Sphenostylis stenocarpa]|uniref:Uncharacterized protein n=1 Tax=Sphenostylis stenocarpa TaxID=92480 RepID=A0AA86RPY2_9FABA|nr:unnamed protein product [Sphenostylis stenocarpa]
MTFPEVKANVTMASCGAMQLAAWVPFDLSLSHVYMIFSISVQLITTRKKEHFAAFMGLSHVYANDDKKQKEASSLLQAMLSIGENVNNTT